MVKNKVKEILDNFKLGKEQEEYDVVHTEIEKGVVFRGTNLIILICAILVASIGLNMNSTAVIIGAMLISPLMGPINGIGYSIATYDFILFKSALRNLLFAIIVSLLTSALYFFISPVNTAHSELLARTSPTIYDVLIALSGGVAGMLAINSKLKGNVVPGVAIATALMPPICTAGYGLATLQFNFLFGALYLFTINTVFIAVAAMGIAQLLRFPIRTIVDEKKARQVNQLIWFVLSIVTIPSIIFGYQLVKEEEFIKNAKNFVKKVSVQEKSFLLDHNINSQVRSIRLIYSGYGVSKETKKKILNIAAGSYQLDTTKINITNGTDVSILEQQKQKMQSETDILNNQIAAISFSLQQKQQQIDSIQNIPTIGKVLLEEIKTLYPEIINCAYSQTHIYPDTTLRTVVVLSSKKYINKKNKAKIEAWTKERLKNENTKIYFN